MRYVSMLLLVGCTASATSDAANAPTPTETSSTPASIPSSTSSASAALSAPPTTSPQPSATASADTPITAPAGGVTLRPSGGACAKDADCVVSRDMGACCSEDPCDEDALAESIDAREKRYAICARKDCAPPKPKSCRSVGGVLVAKCVAQRCELSVATGAPALRACPQGQSACPGGPPATSVCIGEASFFAHGCPKLP